MKFYTIHLYTECMSEECKKHSHNTGEYILDQLPSILLICVRENDTTFRGPNSKNPIYIKKSFEGIDKEKLIICYSNYEKSQLNKYGFDNIFCIRKNIKGNYTLQGLIKDNFDYELPKIDQFIKNYKLSKNRIKVRLINITYFLSEIFKLYKGNDLVFV